MAEPPKESPRRSLRGRALAVLVMVVLTELLMRGLFFAYVVLAQPPDCGRLPTTFARLFFAYSNGRYWRLSGDGVAIADPHRGHRSTPKLQGLVVSGAPVFTNSIGARAEHDYAVPAPPGITRIVALGDSMTYGEGVTNDATWPAQLEARLQQTEVVNLGDRAYAHDQMYYALADDGLRLAPDLVVLGFFESDLSRDALVHYCYEKPRLSRGPSGWLVENVPVPTPDELRTRYLLMPLLYGVPRALVELTRRPAATERTGDESGAESLTRIRKLAEGAGARFLLLDLPEHLEQQPGEHDFFASYCARTQTECVETWASFHEAAPDADASELQRRFLRPHDIHYAREGYAVIAAALARYLSEHPVARRAR